MKRNSVLADHAAAEPLFDLTVHDQVPNTAAGAGIGVTIAALGVRMERASRVRMIVEELIFEAREREPFPSADDQSHLVRVCLDLVGSNVRIRVIDHRMPIEVVKTHRLPSRRLAALGFVDSLHISSLGREGNVAQCQVRIDDPPSGTLDSVEVLPEDAEPATAEQAELITVRQMTPDDVLGLIRCVYRCYGYSYPDDVLYQPTVLRRLLRTGLMRSVVAVTPDNELAGHAALTFTTPDERVPEAGRLVVDPRYRGHHLAERLGRARNELAASLNVPGLWAECVTNHVASQRNIIALGGFETGLLIGAGPSDVVMAGLANQNRGRRTLLPFYLPIGRGSEVSIFPTAELRPTLELLTDRLGLARSIEVSDGRPEGATVIEVHTNLVSGVAHLHLGHAGADLDEVVLGELDALVQFELGAVYIDVSLSDPVAPAVISSLELLGFCWGTWIPDAHPGADILRLQRVGEHLSDIDNVKCARAEGDEIRDWVVAQWHRVRRRLITG